MPALHVQLLGDFRLIHGETLVTDFDSARLRALLAYLLLHRYAPLPRQQLAYLFWPDSTEAQARLNLRSLFHRLRQTLPDADRYVATCGQTVQWRPDAPFALDVADFEAAIGQANAAERAGDTSTFRAALEQAGVIYRGDLQPCCYDHWAVSERERLREMAIRAFDRLILLAERQHDYDTAITTAQRLLYHDPLHEATYRRLIRLYAAAGDRVDALRTYHKCATALRRELEVEPSPATQEAYLQVLRTTARPVPTPEPPRRPPNHNLPLNLTSFVGRERQLGEIKHLLGRTRLLTLAGSPGCGKTRLALECAWQLLDEYADGVWRVDLDPIVDSNLVSQAIASALGAAEAPGLSLTAILSDHLRSRHLLLVLDGCDHLVTSAARLADLLLRACPRLRILATSREALSIAGEQVWRVPPLSLPPDPLRSSGGSHAFAPEQFLESEAVRLFIDRATAVLPTFSLTSQNSAAIAEICTQLDGIPLAIELAAARVKVLAVQQIAARLHDPFRLLVAGNRAAQAHQQTLRRAIGWSCDLLSEGEQALFRRLSVFAGGFDLEAAEWVCPSDGVEAGEVLDLLARLADKSLVMVHALPGRRRYGLLETIRQYAAERLCAAGEADVLARRHAEYYLALAEQAEQELKGPRQVAWLRRLAEENDNFCAAMNSALAQGEGETGLRLAAALWELWWLRGDLSEAQRWLSAALAANAEARTAARARALIGAGTLSGLRGDNLAAARHYEESVALYRGLGDSGGLARALAHRGVLAWLQARHASAIGLLEESLSLARSSGNRWGTAFTLRQIGRVRRSCGEPESARAAAEESLALCRELDDTRAIAYALVDLGQIAWDEGNAERAATCCREALARFGELHALWGILWALLLFGLAVYRNDLRRAVQILGAADAVKEALGAERIAGRLPAMTAGYARVVAEAQEALGCAAFSAAWGEGRAMSPERAVEYALTS